jgi:serine/threonine protein kinase
MIEDKNNPDKFKISDLYETQEYIGSGSTGIVYKATNLKTGETVAIKALKTELTKNYKFMFILNEELKRVFELEHKNIVKFYNIISDNDKHFIIMEYIKGNSLDELIKNKKDISIENAIKIITQCAEGLDYASRHNIYHKSLKPENIIITDDFKTKISDFGFSKAMSTAWLTLTGTSPTQVEYMSPEQAEGESADNKTDIYSLGIISYQILTGTVPFKRDGTSILSVAMKHINNKPDYLIDKNPDIPLWLENIVLKCLEKSPNLRFQTGKDLFEAIMKKGEIEENTSELKQDQLNTIDSKLINKTELHNVINESNSLREDDTLIVNNFQEHMINNIDKLITKETELTIPKKTQELSQIDNIIIKDEQVKDIESKDNSKKIKLLLLIFISLFLLIINLIIYIVSNT